MSSILIIGPAITNKYINQVVKFTSQENVDYMFSAESKLAQTYKEVSDSFETIYLANVKDKSSYLEIAKTIDEKMYDYIVPIELYINDLIKENEETKPIVDLFIRIIRPKHSTIIFTGIHATAFYTIEDYITYNIQTIGAFRKNIDCLSYGKNILFTTNNLKSFNYSSTQLACALASTAAGSYPAGKFGTAIFDLENTDFISGIVFFKNNINVSTSIENLTNLYPYYPDKIHSVNLITRHIDNQIQLSYFKGKLYDPKVTLLQIKSKIDEILKINKGICITNYEITNVTCIKKNYCYEINANIAIVPFFTFEKMSMELIRRL